MEWVATVLQMRVHPTAIIVVQEWLPHRFEMAWKWEVKGDTAIKFGYAPTVEQAKEDALDWWSKFTKITLGLPE